MEKKQKISVKRMLKAMNCYFEDHALWELALIKLLEENDSKLYSEKTQKYENAFVSKDVLAIMGCDTIFKEVEFTEKTLKEIIAFSEKLKNTKGNCSLLSLSVIKDNEELLSLYLNNPQILKKLEKETLVLNDIENSLTIINDINLAVEEKKPLLFKTPNIQEIMYLLIDNYNKENFKNIRNMNSSILENFVQELYNNKTYFYDNSISSKLYRNNLEVLEAGITRTLIVDLENNNFDFPIKVLVAFASVEKEHLYQISESVGFFDIIFEEISSKDINLQKEFKKILKNNKLALELFEKAETIRKRELLDDVDFNIKKEVILTMDLDILNNKLFKPLDDDSLYISDTNFSIKLDNMGTQKLIVTYSLDLNNLSEKEVMNEVVDLLVNPKGKISLDTYFRELNLKKILKNKDTEIKVRAKI